MGLYISVADGIKTVFDSGCSVAATSDKNELCGNITPVIWTMSGLGGSVRVEGEDIVKWVFRNDYGVN